MGLDITAYRQLREQPDVDIEDGIPVENRCVTFLNNDAFPGRFDGLKEGIAYSYKESFGFRAGSYSGYNEWREQLAQLAGYRHASACWPGDTGPFSELIDFADNEGSIGPTVSVKLAMDFAEYEERASEQEAWFVEKYQLWKLAFEMAADGGAVDFA